jgi:hypothetical protein
LIYLHQFIEIKGSEIS